MQTLGEIRQILERAGHPPKKALGQNFLIDHNMIRKLVDAAAVGKDDLVLEIGPGTGALSVELLQRGCRVVACELDDALARVLHETLGQRYPDQFTLITGDCLHKKQLLNPMILQAINDEPFSLVANLPYNAATPLMLTLMTRHPACRAMFVTIQHEVVQRFNASPGTKAYGTISVIAQRLGSVGTIAKLPPGCFWPRPGVDSAMMRWTRDPDRPDDPQWWTRMAETTQTLFQSRRKQLARVVASIARDQIQWPKGVKPTDRVDALSPQRVEDLCRAIDRIGYHG